MSYNENMKEVYECPVCNKNGGGVEFFGFAILAPWISELLEQPIQKTKLFKCQMCELIFFSRRYSDLEMEKIYRNYRGDRYYKLRHRWEPWYGPKENDLYSPEASENLVFVRRSDMQSALERSGVQFREGYSVLDFGGDKGQFLPDDAGACYILDPSSYSVQMDSRTRRIGFLEELREATIDLVMACGVFEHLSDPSEQLQKISRILKPINGTILIQVPQDGFRTHQFHKTKTYERYLNLLLKVAVKAPTIFVFFDLLSGIYRNTFARMPIFGVIKQSEHINYFTKRSLENLVHDHFQVKDIHLEPRKKHGKFKLGEISMVVTLK